MNNNAEAVKIAKNLTPIIESVTKRMTDNCMRSKLYMVSSAPSDGKIGVKDAFDDYEMRIPYASSLSDASVGDAVWCIWMGSNQSTMVAMWKGDIVSSTGGGGEYEHYTGTYTITPRVYSQSMDTVNKVMDDDVTIHEIPLAEVSNLSGGMTATIG